MQIKLLPLEVGSDSLHYCQELRPWDTAVSLKRDVVLL